MTNQDDLLSSLIKGFPKGVKLNRTIPLLPEIIEKFHNELHVAVEQHGYKYRDIINELKVVDENKKVSVSIKLSLYRNAVMLSAESDNVDAAKEMIRDLEKLISDLH
jgi:hypothetical protein